MNDAAPSPSTEPGPPSGWADLLPPRLLPLVVWPRSRASFRDASLPADRTLGYDGSGRPAYCAHRHLSHRVVSSDDAEYEELPALSECLTAWRLRDGGWVVHRSVRRWNGCAPTEWNWYSVRDAMPR